MTNNTEEITIQEYAKNIWQTWGLLPWGLLLVTLAGVVAITIIFNLRFTPIQIPQYQASTMLVLDSHSEAALFVELSPLMSDQGTIPIHIALSGDNRLLTVTAVAEHPDVAQAAVDLGTGRIRAAATRMRQNELDLARTEYVAYLTYLDGIALALPESQLEDVDASFAQIIGRFEMEVQEISVDNSIPHLGRDIAIASILALTLGITAILVSFQLTAKRRTRSIPGTEVLQA